MNRNVPKVLFKGTFEPWKPYKLTDVANYFRGSFPQPYGNKDWYDEINGTPFVQVADIGFDLRLNDETKLKISKLAEPKSRYVKKGKVIVALQGSIETSIGRVAITQYAAFFDRTILIFDSYNVPINEQFFAYVIQRIFKREKESAPGVTISTITKEALGYFDTALPSVETQQKIGTFFKQLDDTISLQQQMVKQQQQYKKAMLQKMFPQRGERVPKVRFDGFSGDWTNEKLSCFFKKYQETIYLDDNKEYSQISIRNNGLVEIRGIKKGIDIGRKRQYLINTKDYPNTLTFTRQTIYQGGIGFIPELLNGSIVTENMPLLSMNQNLNINFILSLFKTKLYYQNVIGKNMPIGSAQKALHEKVWLESELLFPSLEEQQKIGDYFKQLNDTIALHQKKLKDYEQLKKALLLRMFV